VLPPADVLLVVLVWPLPPTELEPPVVEVEVEEVVLELWELVPPTPGPLLTVVDPHARRAVDANNAPNGNKC